MRSSRFVTVMFIALLSVRADSALASRVIDDFEDRDLLTDTNLGWIVLADDLFGGSSHSKVEIVSPGASGSKAALRISGRAVKDGAPFILAGSWTPLDASGGPCDLTGFDGIRFRVRGRATGEMEVGVRRGSGSGLYNVMGAFTVREDWNVVEIPFRSLVAKPPAKPGTEWDPTSVWYFGFSTPANVESEFSIELDDVELVGGSGERAQPAATAVPYSILTTLASTEAARSLSWRNLASEEAGDAQVARLPDARSLGYHYDASADRMWFRVQLESTPPGDWFGLNVAVDADRDQTNGSPWWGTNKAFHWDRLISAYLFRVGDRWQGILGVADSAGVARGEMGSLATTEVIVGADRDEPALFVGVPRASIDDDLEMNVIATVGSAMAPNDDVPNAGFATTKRQDMERW